jgi:hypothetical protein
VVNGENVLTAFFHFTAGIVDICGKFTAGVVDWKDVTAGVNSTGENLPPVNWNVL